MAESLGSAVLDLTADNTGLNRTVDGAERKVSGLGDTFKRVGKSMSGFGDKLSTRVTLPILAVAAATFKLASDAEESSNKFEIVMGASADSVRASLKDLEQTIPLTTGELLTLAAGTQDLLVPMGLTREAGAAMSTQFLELAGDIAAFNDVSPAQVLADIKSGLIGSSEPLFKYGVDTRVAALEAVALANGLILQGEKLTDVTRAQAVLIQIQNQSKDAMGAARREMDGASAASRFLFRDVKQLGEEIGVTLIPIITPMIQKVREWIQWFRELSPATQQMIVKTALLVAAVGPLLSIFGRLTSGAGALISVIKLASGPTGLPAMAGSFSKLIPILTGPVGIVLAIAAVALALSSFITKEGGMLENWIAKTTESLGDIRGSLTDNIPAVNDLADTFRKQFPAITAEISKGVTAGDSYANILETLKVRFEEGTAEGDALRSKLDELEAAERAAAAAAAEKLNPAIETTGVKAGAAEKELAKLEAIVGKLGFVTAKNATDELDNLTKAFESGLVPQDQMVAKVTELTAKYSELGLLSPAVQAELAAITLKLQEQGAEIDSKTLASLGRYKLALEQIEATRMKEWQDGWSASLVDSTGAMTDLGTASEDFFKPLPIKVPEITDTFTNLFGELKTGIPLFDDLLSGATNFISGLLSGLPLIGDLFGSIFGEGGNIASFAQQLFGGGSGSIGGIIGSALGGPLGSIVVNFASKIAGMLFGAVGSALSSIFGGPSEAELAGRDAAAAFRDQLTGMLDDQQRAEAGTDAWKQSVIGLRDTFLAFGRTEAEALAFSERLWAAEAEGPEAVAALIAEIGPMMTDVSAAMEATGLTLTELRNKAINDSIRLGISVAEAFQNILNNTEEMANAAAASTTTTADRMAIAMNKASGRIETRVKAMGLSAEREAIRIQRAQERAAIRMEERFSNTSDKSKLKFVEMSTTLGGAMTSMVQDTTKAQNEMLRLSVRAAGASGDAWVASARAASRAWDNTRNDTVGGSSILDIEKFGSLAAAQLEANQVGAAMTTGAVWEREGTGIEQILKKIADGGASVSADIGSGSGTAQLAEEIIKSIANGGGEGGAGSKREERTTKRIETRIAALGLSANRQATRIGRAQERAAKRMNAKVADGGRRRRANLDSVTAQSITARPIRGLKGGGSINLNLDLDGETITRKVVKLTPAVLDKLGLI